MVLHKRFPGTASAPIPPKSPQTGWQYWDLLSPASASGPAGPGSSSGGRKGGASASL